MIVKRFYDEKLAQASYLIGCGATGEALVVDANRDVQPYIDAARQEGLRITHVTETHIHADYVSGSRELAQRTGARLYLSDEGDENWKYTFAADAGAVLVHDGDSFKVGNIRIDVLHTPGHTPEHLTFLVTDTAAADRPIAAVTGDFVFVGDVGRPDLLEKAAGVAGTMTAAASALYRSLQRFVGDQPDWLQIWPGHGAGSACGKGLSAIPHSTLGYEKLFNWAFGAASEEEFVAGVLEGQPEPPKYFAQMKRINKEGPRVLGGFKRPPEMPAEQLGDVVASGALVVDTRMARDFAAGHVPGTINIPLNRAFTTWAGWLVPYDREFYVIVDASVGDRLDEVVRDLAMIGLDRLGGYFDKDAIAAWRDAGGELQKVPQIGTADLLEGWRSGRIAVLDVRGRSEWDEGHIPGALHIPVGYITDHLSEIPRDQPLAVHCHSASRSDIATSVLQANGFTNVLAYGPGWAEWSRTGQPAERDGELVAR